MSKSLCDQGCGNEALFYSRHTKKWRCEKISSKCPAVAKRISKKTTAFLTGKTWDIRFGEEKSKIVKAKCRKSAQQAIAEGKNHGCFGKPWYESKEGKRHLMRAGAKGGGYRRRGGRGKQGWYKGFWCDSSWELAFLIYHLDHHIEISRNELRFVYTYKGKKKRYIPDFKANGLFVEIKGYMTEEARAKIQQFTKPLVVIAKKEIGLYLDYVIEVYGDDFIRLYESEAK